MNSVFSPLEQSHSIKNKSFNLPKCSSSFLVLSIILTPLILLLLLQPLNPSTIPFFPSPPRPAASLLSNHAISMLRHSITFLPLKDLRLSDHPTDGNTWFMSSVPDSPSSEGEPACIRFPSAATRNRLLCISAADPHDGARNSYALAFPEALPENSTLLPGLTFVADAFYDYSNLWHGVSAITPFVRWHAKNGCAAPARWALFHRGEVRKEMGGWVRTLAEASIGGEVRVVEAAERVSCFEEAVVMRRIGGGMSREKREDAYELMRCRAREYCGLERKEEGMRGSGEIGMTLLFRMGSRSFKNETAVAGVFERECRKVEGCRVTLARPSNLSFCDQCCVLAEIQTLLGAGRQRLLPLF
ncbi:hypothetical protein KSP39_PZI016690 [Platanthera zijinensis]|uniref:Uncharacterized protein n=1 Tax=Platanthera zijinensis TaxID=2320716 RepID=A0AAP0B6L2_9ASPA